MKTAIGFDTGGTYTDAVLYDFESKKILGTGKALTTREDLCKGIANVLDLLPQDLCKDVCAVSLSTTLATNACVENKGGNARLIFFGGDREIVARYGAEYGLPPAREIWMPDCKTGLDGSIARMPDWEEFERLAPAFCKDADGVGVIELYSMRNNAVIEKKAKEILTRTTGLPVTCGYELFNELNSLQRGAGTLLNAQLYPVICEFIRAVKKVLSERGIHAPAVIMRSDGSLMSEEFARTHPVETLLCGPAASVMGGLVLTGKKDAVVVDMGGTTTDIALIDGGIPVRAENGVSIGKWRTLVNGLMIRTFGLGGDSGIRYRNKNLVLEEFRMIPLCVAATKYPAIAEKLKALEESGKFIHSHYKHEFYLLARPLREDAPCTAGERALCRALQNGPLPLEEAAAAAGEDVYTFRPERLLREGVLQIVGLTPTDIMHVRGEFTDFDKGTAERAARMVAANLQIDTAELCERVYREIRRKMYANIVKLLLQHEDKFYAAGTFGKETDHWIDSCFLAAERAERDGLQPLLHTKYALVGIGAPVSLFLKDVAALLGTRAIVPPHAAVANALGAVSGSVYARRTAEIRSANEGFIVYGNDSTMTFAALEQAEAYAEKDARNAALACARERGARGEIGVTLRRECSTSATAYDEKEDSLFLGETVIAEAVASIGFEK